MPELAEVELAKKIWERALGQRVLTIAANQKARIFRDQPASSLSILENKTLLTAHRHGKRMYFTFDDEYHLEVHLGMSGKVFTSPPPYEQRKHDHLIISMDHCTLILNDYRMFGKVTLHNGTPPWQTLPPDPLSRKLDLKLVEEIIRRRGKKVLKGALLDQSLFPGIGNWMADEICWRLATHPATPLNEIPAERLLKEVKFVCKGAIKYVVEQNLEHAGSPESLGFKAGGYVAAVPPKNWLFQHRWTKGGDCPQCKKALERDTIATRTTAWCSSCQA